MRDIQQAAATTAPPAVDDTTTEVSSYPAGPMRPATRMIARTPAINIGRRKTNRRYST